MMRSAALITIVLALVVSLFVALMADERSLSSLMLSRGYIESGSKFGLEIGMDRGDVSNKLMRQGLKKLDRSVDCNPAHFVDGRLVEYWADDSWRKGTICVSYTDNGLKGISWYYSFLQP